MRCEDFQDRLADILGGEMTDEQRAAYDAHRATCASCREEFESLAAIQSRLRSLPGPGEARLVNDGGRWTLDKRGDAPRPRSLSSPASRGRPRRGASMLRRAAGLMIAFTAGYAAHAILTLGSGASSRDRRAADVTRVLDAEGLRAAVAMVHQSKPATSDLAKVMMALSARKR